MSTALALSMLYEVLVAESKYESRGIEYRSRLKRLYQQMLDELRAHNDFPIKFIKQAQNKFIESLSESVKVLDPTEIQPTDLELCYGIHQYVFPKIPDFNALDARFLTKWHKFYNALPAFVKQPDRKTRRTKEKGYQMSKRRNVKDSDSSSESDASEVKSKEPVVITEEDFEEPKPKQNEEEKEKEDASPKAEDLGSSQQDPVERDAHLKLPIVTNAEVEIIDDTIVFGLMDEEKMTEWASTSSFDTYKDLYRQIYYCDPTLKSMYNQNDDLTMDVKDDEVCSMELDETVKQEDSELLEKLGNINRSSMSEKTDTSSSSSSLEDEKSDMIGTRDFYKESKIQTIPGCHKVNTESFDVNSIFGNYYCPLAPKAENGVEEEGVGGTKRPRDEETSTPTKTVTNVLGNIYKSTVEYLKSSSLTPRSSNTETPTKKESLVKEETKDLMNLKNYSINFMEVESNYSCTNTGNFEVRCTARIKEPFLGGLMKGGIETNIGLYQELQVVLKKLFSLKKRISGGCSVCSGWNLLHGIAQSFCEYCEDKLLNCEPELLLKIFEIRRYLLSSMYPVVGYKYETLNVFKDEELVTNWKELLKTQKVSIQSLTQVGSSFPKASLHDGRYLPSPLTLPEKICDTINTFQYPKFNFPAAVSGNTTTNSSSMWKLDCFSPAITPVKNAYTNGSSVAANSNSGYSSVCRGSTTSIHTDGFNTDVSYRENGDRKPQTFSLMDMVRYRRLQRARAMNDFLEEIFVNFHSKYKDERPYRLFSNYMNILKGGLLLSTHLNNPYNYPGKDELDQVKSDWVDNDKEKQQKGKNKKQNGKEKGVDKYKTMDREKDTKENYFDESVSFILSKLPLDTDLLKQSFYHRGVYSTKIEHLKNYAFIHIGKMFGFKEVVYNQPPLDSIVDSAMLPVLSVDSTGSIENGALNPVNVTSEGEIEDEHMSSTNSLDPTEEEEVDEVFAYNWHEVLYCTLKKRPYLKTSIENNTDLMDQIKQSYTTTLFDTNITSTRIVNRDVLKLLYKYKLLQYMPRHVLKEVMSTGKMKIGFPTSLEMYVLNIPDSILDCSMYGGVGKGFLYSLDMVLDSLSLLSTVMKIGTVDDKKHRNIRPV